MTIAKVAAAVLGLGIACSGAAHAQDFARDFDDVRAARSDDNSVMLRWSAPFGGRDEREAAPRLALRLNQSLGGDMRSLDVLSYSFGASDTERLSTPFRMNVNGEGEGVGGWVANHPILFGVGAGLLIWGIIEATEDDDDEPAPVVQN